MNIADCGLRIAERGTALLVALALFMTGCKPAAAPEPPQPKGLLTLAVPEQGAYTGAYIDFGDNEDEVTLEAIEGFEKLVGKHQAIVASSSYWGEQSFPTANLTLIWRHGSVPLVFWSPWDRPYQQELGLDRFALSTILEGQWDAYIDRWAEAARQFGHPVLVSFANEMNGTWFPWSGWFNGGQTPVAGASPKGPFEGPEIFKKAYRYVVDRVRAKGASNILWVFHVANYSIPQEPWNAMGQYYPGPDYVDWLGASVYGEQFSDDPWSSFAVTWDWPYRELCALDPSKPIMLAEWGVGEFPRKGKKADFVRDALNVISGNYPRVKAAVFWHERWQNAEGEYSNLHAHSSPESLAAFRHGIANPLWLDQPILIPVPKVGAGGASADLPNVSNSKKL
jgi:hypothetical protein